AIDAGTCCGELRLCGALGLFELLDFIAEALSRLIDSTRSGEGLPNVSDGLDIDAQADADRETDTLEILDRLRRDARAPGGATCGMGAASGVVQRELGDPSAQRCIA